MILFLTNHNRNFHFPVRADTNLGIGGISLHIQLLTTAFPAFAINYQLATIN